DRVVAVVEDLERDQRLATALGPLLEQEHHHQHHAGRDHLGDGHRAPDLAPVVRLPLDQPVRDEEQAAAGQYRTQPVQPIPAVAPQMPNAAPRFSGGKITVRTDSVCGVSSAPPRPRMIRNTISWVGLCAKPHATEASVKITRPTRNSCLGPYRSPSRPAVIRSTA